MDDRWLLIVLLALGTLVIRLAGYLLGARLPRDGRWARGFAALPGCLILALTTVLLLQTGPLEWTAAAVATAVAIPTRNLPLTMLAGMTALGLLRLWA